MSVSDFEIRRFDVIESTNAYLVSEALLGAPDKTVAVASHQSAGKGRRGRSWEAPPGASLLMSVLFRVPLAPEELMVASQAVSLSARAAIETKSGAKAQLKWPNDLLIDQKKAAGLLAEMAKGGEGSQESAIVVGIGINLLWPGPPEAQGTSILDSTGIRLSPEELLDELLSELAQRDELLRSESGRDRLFDEFVSHLGTLGTQVKVELTDETVVGRATGVTREGHLLVETDTGVRELLTGDVVHLRPDL